MEKKMMLLVNPNAGKGGYKAVLADILAVFSTNDILPTVYFTKYSGHSSELIEKYAQQYDLIVCLGGDGTLSEVVAGVMRLEEKRPIGYFPLGTANDVARTLGLSGKTPTEIAKRIVNGETIRYDVGQFGTDKFFTYIAGFGAFTDVSYVTPQDLKQSLGHLAYMLEAVKRLPKLTHYKAIVEYDDGVISDDFIFGAVTNSTSVAGLVRLNSDNVQLSDGMFEVLLVKTPQDIKALNDIISAVLSNNFDQQNVVFLKSKEVRIMFEKPAAWTRDGEDGGVHQDVFIVNHCGGVELLV